MAACDLKPINMVMKYAELTKDKFEYVVEYDKKSKKYLADLHLGKHIFKGKGQSKKEARDAASRLASTRLQIPDFLRRHYREYRGPRAADKSNDSSKEIVVKCKELRYYKHYQFHKVDLESST